MAPGDGLIAIIFDDDTRETGQAAQLARGRGHPVVAITDNDLDPVLPLAAVSLHFIKARPGAFSGRGSPPWC